MIKRLHSIFAGSIMACLLLLAPLRVAAYSPYEGVDCSGKAASSTVCQSRASGDTSNPLYGNGSVMVKAINIIAVFSGIVAVFVIVVAGGRFVFSSGDSNNVKTARNAILYAIVGLLVIVLARAIIIFVINRFT